MPKVFSPEERKLVKELAEQNLPHKKIAEAMSFRFPDNWKAKNAFRSVARILKEEGEPITDSHLKAIMDPSRTLDEMTRDERLSFRGQALSNATFQNGPEKL